MLFVTKFVNGTRVPAQVLAGYLRYPYLKFLLYNYSGAAIYIGLIFFLAVNFRKEEVESYTEPEFLLRIAVFIIVLFAAQWWIKRQFFDKYKENGVDKKEVAK